MGNNQISFETKARNLQKLIPLLKNAEILPLLILEVKEVFEAKTIEKIQSVFKDQKVIIRSSSFSEDCKENSNAGAFLSLINIESNDTKALLSALHEVADRLDAKDEILIQPMLEEITQCGVAFSVDKDNLSPYFCIQYDESGSNSSVTDGSSTQLLTLTHFRDAPLPSDKKLRQIIVLLLELEEIFNYKALDIEFAYSKNDDEEKLFLLQVRPLVVAKKQDFSSLITQKMLTRLAKRFNSLQFCHSDVLGSKTIFGVMPDWNPAEIIGLRPKRLALSLYKEIVTDNIWAYQRDNYGYRKLRSHPLMHSFCGIPYIDVRLSFNSFIPKKLSKNIAQKLVEYYMDCLISKPYLHDKIEFDIVFSCYDFSIQDRLNKLLNYGFTPEEISEIKNTLLEITNNIIHPKNGLYLKDLAKIDLLKDIFLDISRSHLSCIDKIYWLIENCKRYGTLPFAGIARAGFVAMQLLNSLVDIGFFSKEERMSFLNSLNTKAKQLGRDIANLTLENKEKFLEEYGHLRAGTYNILSPRYDEDFDFYFNLGEEIKDPILHEFELDDKRLEQLEKLLNERGIAIDANNFLLFIRRAIEGREFAKFEFSKLLSQAIKLIAELGGYYQIGIEDMAHVDIKVILDLYASFYSQNPRDRILSEIENNKVEYQHTLAIKLPSLLCRQEDIFSFLSRGSNPNFITQKVVSAPVATEKDKDFQGKIVLIYAADPGYDYLFSKDIAGFITCYGGANSHMAIRASELSIPAVIGVGEEIFKKCLQVKQICIDCESEQILFL
ncbi:MULTISPECIES: PEP-utilizing enzyme [unclassified Helicobacter]|uniref:PEP-utilizing enzyme n=1 Tax=unclassified Helicobacter TaxID=2593540 RepID=UPI000CF1439F|nr:MULTISPECIES: PEP-utilizing enzyme [unclassified Helicobacter]